MRISDWSADVCSSDLEETEVEDSGDDLDDLDLEEVEDADEDETEADEAPKAKGKRGTKKAAAPKKKPANAVEFGTAELLALNEQEHGKAYDGSALRVLLRKMQAAGALPGDAADTSDERRVGNAGASARRSRRPT